MLTNLYIENIAVIEKVNIDFTDGFNVLTGETGAGKSIVIDSINAVLGNRTAKSLIRSGFDSAFVSATFENVSDYAVKKAKSLGFEDDGKTLILQRTLSTSGKNVCHINSRPATVSALKELSPYLIGIHGQNDNMELMSPSVHIRYIDALAKLDFDLKEYKEVFAKLKEAERKLNDANDDETLRFSRIDLLTYQIGEIEDADIKVGEMDALNEEKTVLLNSEKIAKELRKAKICLDSDDETNGALTLLDDASSSLIFASRYMSSVEPISDRLSNALYELQDCSSEIERVLDDIDSSPQRLDEIEERLDVLYKISKKYGATEAEILDYLMSAKDELSSLKNYEENREKLIQEYNEYLEKANVLATKLSKKRQETCTEFKKKVESEMAFLDMPNVRLEIDFSHTELSARGYDKIEFLISANPGEEPKPVSKIASGGELSRMMLAIKTVLSSADFVDTQIFDEIDTGVSGSAAEKIGRKLKELSEKRQVMCVTHQAQIAAFADNHLKISKEVIDEKTYTNVKTLDYDGRVQELARIIDGVTVSETALQHAKKLLSNS